MAIIGHSNNSAIVQWSFSFHIELSLVFKLLRSDKRIGNFYFISFKQNKFTVHIFTTFCLYMNLYNEIRWRGKKDGWMGVNEPLDRILCYILLINTSRGISGIAIDSRYWQVKKNHWKRMKNYKKYIFLFLEAYWYKGKETLMIYSTIPKICSKWYPSRVWVVWTQW